MIKIACPFCEQAMGLKTLKAGQFRTTCKHCGNLFSIRVQVDEGQKPKIRISKEQPQQVPPPIPSEPAKAPKIKPVGRQVSADPTMNLDTTKRASNSQDSEATDDSNEEELDPFMVLAWGIGAFVVGGAFFLYLDYAERNSDFVKLPVILLPIYSFLGKYGILAISCVLGTGGLIAAHFAYKKERKKKKRKAS